ncbi:MAG: DUF2828 family protein [Clostridia bacterium]|nr:DUF2828 family protein [Clostridia bacterium]
MNKFVQQLAKEANYTTTLNGAVTHASAGDACLDLFSTAGALRRQSEYEQIRRFARAYAENRELAMKLLFHIRDIREGLGERQLFRTLIRYTAKRWPESAKKNVALIAEYGRWDDLMCLMGTKAEKEVVRCIREQLEKDMAALSRRLMGDAKARISLMAKWLPSINTSSARTRGQARVLCRALGMNEQTYRRMLSALRRHSGIVERSLTQKKLSDVRYEHVPGQAMLKYRSAFAKRDGRRYGTYLRDVADGRRTMHAGTLYPYEILRPYFETHGWGAYAKHVAGEKTLEALWSSLPNDVEQENAISVIDTSGSMYCFGAFPAMVSQALGIYHAERCKGPFHGKFITFSERPHLESIRGETLKDKLFYLSRADWGESTNMEAVFDLILRTAIACGAGQDEMPATLYIISDMEFNQAVRNPNETVYESAKKEFEANGYRLPTVVFHNVNSWQMQAPVTAHTLGTALVSGAGTKSFRRKFNGNSTPMSHMLEVLGSERYAAVHA